LANFSNRGFSNKFGQNRDCTISKPLQEKNAPQLVFYIKIYTIYHSNRFSLICPSYHENKILSFQLDIALFRKAIPLLVLSFEVAHSTRSPASRVIRLNHAEIPMDISR